MASPRRPGHFGNGAVKPLSIDGSLRESRSSESPLLSPDADSPSSTDSPNGRTPPSASAFANNFEVLPSPTPSSLSFPPSINTPPLENLSVPPFNYAPSSPTVSSPLSSSHRRGPSVSYNSPPSPSTFSFGAPHRRTPSVSFTSPLSPAGSTASPSSAFSAAGKRHGRIHSRNLSVFFPRPENAASSTIAEDETVTVGGNADSGLPPPSPRRLMEGFQFGGNTRMDADATPPSALGSLGNMSKRRGHHHKHSVSHSFFDFVPPAETSAPDETVEASSPWMPITPGTPGQTLGDKTRIERGSSPLPRAYRGTEGQGDLAYLARVYERELAVGFSVLQFMIGAFMWAAGQSRGSLACSGLGYWVVFDSSSLALSCNAIPWLRLSDDKDSNELRRPFG